MLESLGGDRADAFIPYLAALFFPWASQRHERLFKELQAFLFSRKVRLSKTKVN
jgi:hypothetical protein